MVCIPICYVLFRYLYLVPHTRAGGPGYAGSWAQARGLMGPGIRDGVNIAPFSAK